jgi:MFS family permease
MNLTESIPHKKQVALQSVFLVTNAIIYYFLATIIFQDVLASVTTNFLQIQLMWVIHFGTLAISLIVGATLMRKIERKKLFTLWTIIGIVSPLPLIALNFAPIPIALLFSILFAVSTGLGMPNCMEYFKRSTDNGNRGRYAGLILLLGGVGLFSLRLASSAVEISTIILIIWRLTGLLAVFLVKPFKENVEKGEKISFGQVFRQRSFILYVIPWLLFSLVDYLSIPVQFTILGQSTVTFLQIIENVISGVCALAAGFLIDRFGRKHLAIGGFVLLGLGYAVLGLYPNELTSWYVYTVFDGITWGILGVLFVFVIWGEINQHASTDRYYAIGILPFFFSRFLGLVLTNYISVGISSYALFSFIAFFLFLAVLPLVYAPETLPEKIMKDRDLKSYIENAKKKAQKDDDKAANKKEENSKKRSEEKPQDANPDEAFEEAKRLAEKYC